MHRRVPSHILTLFQSEHLSFSLLSVAYITSREQTMSRQTQRPLPSHPHPLEYRAPKSNPSTHPHAPRLRRSMSRVLSRVISITRKEQPLTQATLKEGNARVVHIDRGYEVIPRVTSTHLKRSQNGLREVETNVPILDPQRESTSPLNSSMFTPLVASTDELRRTSSNTEGVPFLLPSPNLRTSNTPIDD